MSSWHEVSRHEPCGLCGKASWCATSTDGAWAICRRGEAGTGLRRVDKAGAEYWLYRRPGPAPETRPPAAPVPPVPTTTAADPATRHRVYRALLAELALTPVHRQALRQRGLRDEEIARREYRSLPVQGRAALARRLMERCGPDVCRRVPGFYLAQRDGRGWWSLAGAAGLLVPVRDLDGQMVALKVRADTPGERSKYSTVSSATHGGPGPGANVHVPLAAPSGETVRVTEGELKGDVATALSGLLTVSLPGVALWRQALPILQARQVRRVLLAFDADWRANAHVAQALGHAALALVAAGYAVEVEIWEAALGKGIDDLLAAGHTPTLTSVALAFGAALRGQATVWTGRLPTVDAAEVRPWH